MAHKVSRHYYWLEMMTKKKRMNCKTTVVIYSLFVLRKILIFVYYVTKSRLQQLKVMFSLNCFASRGFCLHLIALALFLYSIFLCFIFPPVKVL